ncbi:Uncharacterised protein [Mycobacterium tuberculosis]|nr:Uncharacterised protein [Mycobacterium tuberculosis]CNM79129.1 Uncharacterised protein [Mycobacterium tuberculosis]
MPALSGNLPPSRNVSRTHTKCAEPASSSSTQSRLRLGGITPSRNIWQSPIIWKTAAPPLAWPVRLFCDTTNSGAPSERPRASASRSCNSVSLGSLASVEVSCLEMTATSSAATPSLASARASGESLPPRPAPSAPRPGAGIEVCTPSPNDCANATTASTGSPIRSARSPRANRIVPPPWASTKPRRRRSLGRENFESWMPRPRIMDVSAVAAMSPNPMMPSSVRSSRPPATTS